MSLSYGLALSGLLSFTITMTCSVENKMVSVERIKQFTNLPSEAAWKIADKSPPRNWPNHGTIELNNLQVCLSSYILTFLHVSNINHFTLYLLFA
jgi:hypothetical protein